MLRLTPLMQQLRKLRKNRIDTLIFFKFLSTYKFVIQKFKNFLATFFFKYVRAQNKEHTERNKVIYFKYFKTKKGKKNSLSLYRCDVYTINGPV